MATLANEILAISDGSIVASREFARSASVSDSMAIRDSISAIKMRLDASAGRWIAPIHITPQNNSIPVQYWAGHALRHPSRFYEPRIKSYGTFTRAISAPVGFVKTGDCTIQIADGDNAIRQVLSPKSIKKAKAEILLGPEGGRMAGFLRPFTREVAGLDQGADGELFITLRDYISAILEQPIPSLMNTTNFPNLPDNSAGEFAPIIFSRVSCRDSAQSEPAPEGFFYHYVYIVISKAVNQLIPDPGGALKAILIDSSTHAYLIARHPCRSVDVWRKESGDDVFLYVPTSQYSKSTVLIASGHLCQIITFSADQGDAEIRVNVEGIYEADHHNEFVGFFGWKGDYVDSLGIIYKDVVSGAPIRTSQANDTESGDEFTDPDIPSENRILAINIWAGIYIDALQLIYTDPDDNVTYGTKHGGGGGTLHVFELAENEFITKVSGKYGDYIDSMTIETNLKISPTYGGSGGGPTFEFSLNTLTGFNFSDAIKSLLLEMGIENSMDRINLASFEETRTRVDDLVCAGAFTSDVFCDKNDRMTAKYTTDSDTPVLTIDDTLLLHKGTVRQSMAEKAFNQLPYRYSANYVTDKWTEGKYDNAEDQAAIGSIESDEPVQLYFVRDAPTAETVIAKRAEYLELDCYLIEGEIPLIPSLDLELGDLIEISHFGEFS
jgi:hypothetical protein